MNQAIEALLTRRSVRKFKPEQITDEELKTVLEAGTFAPTSRGNQDPWIVAVQNEAIKDELIKMNADVMGAKTNPYYNAPTIVLVFASIPEKMPNSIYDGSLVLGNMMNAAHAIGLGSCWIHREKEMFATERGKQLMKEFGLPDDLMGIGALALGYPDQPTLARKPRKADYYRIIK
jgi:nitroreductase